MSILIKGLEMPTGSECLILTIYPDGQCFEHVYNGSFGSREERKALSVPHHGRLVDADALISGCKDEKGSYYGHESAIIGEAVEAAPTVIEAEE